MSPVMTVLVRGLLAVATVFAASGATDAAEPHPLIGRWTWTVPDNGCSETYTWRADGTGFVTSGAEVTETRFKFSTQPDRNGFYTFMDEVVKDHGGKDCANVDKNDRGRKVTLYILLHDAGDQILICTRPKQDRCFGPLSRVADQDT